MIILFGSLAWFLGAILLGLLVGKIIAYGAPETYRKTERLLDRALAGPKDKP